MYVDMYLSADQGVNWSFLFLDGYHFIYLYFEIMMAMMIMSIFAQDLFLFVCEEHGIT